MIAAGSGLRMCLIVSGIVKVSDAGYMTDEAMSPLRRASMMATPLAAASYRASGLVHWPIASFAATQHSSRFRGKADITRAGHRTGFIKYTP
jgi:hypothetical protein